MEIQHINLLLLLTCITSIKIDAMDKKSPDFQLHKQIIPHIVTSLTLKEEKTYKKMISEQEYINGQFPYIFLLEENQQSSTPFIPIKNLPHSCYGNGNFVCSLKLLSTRNYSLFPKHIDK